MADDQALLDRLKGKLAECDNPVLSQMLEDRLAELTGRSPYSTARDDLERAFIELRKDELSGTKQYNRRWQNLRMRVLTTHGWTEDEFYQEMDRRAEWRK